MARSGQRAGAAIPALALVAIALGLAAWVPVGASAASASPVVAEPAPGTLQRLLDAATPGAVVVVPPGVYREQVTIDRPLTLRGDHAEIRGSDVWSDWQVAGNRCITYGMMGKYDQAFADCNGLIEKQPKNVYAINNRADVSMMKGDLDAALKDYNTAIQISPNNVRAHSGRGQIYERKNDLAQARADYRAAAYSLTKFDETEVARARAIAQERLAALTPQAPAGATGRRVALVIGNGAYKNVHALPNPPRDSKLIANALRDVGFQTVISVSDLTRDKFFEALQTFAAEAEKADWAVVYYAGHGFEIGGVNYLVPVDAKLAADRDAEAQAVALEQVIAAVGAARKVRLVMLDACRDNPFAPTMQRTLSLKLVDKGFSNIEPGAGFMVVYAAKHGETAMDGDGGADSPFATALAREIKQPRVEIRKLFDIVRDDVWSATRHGQQPFTYGSPPGREDFYFVGK